MSVCLCTCLPSPWLQVPCRGSGSFLGSATSHFLPTCWPLFLGLLLLFLCCPCPALFCSKFQKFLLGEALSRESQMMGVSLRPFCPRADPAQCRGAGGSASSPSCPAEACRTRLPSLLFPHGATVTTCGGCSGWDLDCGVCGKTFYSGLKCVPRKHVQVLSASPGVSPCVCDPI